MKKNVFAMVVLVLLLGQSALLARLTEWEKQRADSYIKHYGRVEKREEVGSITKELNEWLSKFPKKAKQKEIKQRIRKALIKQNPIFFNKNFFNGILPY